MNLSIVRLQSVTASLPQQRFQTDRPRQSTSTISRNTSQDLSQAPGTCSSMYLYHAVSQTSPSIHASVVEISLSTQQAYDGHGPTRSLVLVKLVDRTTAGSTYKDSPSLSGGVLSLSTEN